MAFYAWPYRVLYHDTMALGWHHFLTNFKFQCEAREHFLYRHMLATPEAIRESADVAPVTHEGYSRNLAPVKVGETVGILMSFEEATPASVYFCFRVVRHDGVPVACGYQRMVAASISTGAIGGFPDSLRHHAFQLREKLAGPNFRERVFAGKGMEQVFDDEVIRLARQVALEEREGPMPAPAPLAADGSKRLIFLFPGTGAFQPELLAEVARMDGGAAKRLQRASEIVESLLGVSLKPLMAGGKEAEYLRAYPELVHVGVYLSGAVAGSMLLDRGVRPALMAGHSVGEIAALVTAGAFSFETGVEVIAKRILALRAVKDQGSMLALLCTPKRARTMIECLGRSTLNVAVINLADQCVVSGTHADLDRLAKLAAHLSIAALRVGSDVPFHSRLLGECVEPWRRSLQRLSLGQPRVPVFSPMERGWYGPHSDFAALLPSHFVRPLLFHEALDDLYALGGRTFIECGGGKTLTSLVSKAFPASAGVQAVSAFHPAGSFGKSVARVLEVCGVAAPRASVAPKKRAPKPAEPLEPIAVVGMGCVVPGALDPAALWKKVLDGTTDIANTPLPDVQDFLGSANSQTLGILPVADKTYTTLCGAVSDFVADATLPRFSTAGQQFLAAVLAQSLAGLTSPLPAQGRTHLLLGSTGDGAREYDMGLLTASLVALVRSAKLSAELEERLCAVLESLLGRRVAESGDLSPAAVYQVVADQMLGPGVRVLAMDAACASSLYSIGHAVRRLRRGDCDLALAGGVFTPGPANSCLFAQFRGLSTTGSRPFDATADGVVFSEGAGILALKRLSDAVEAKDTIHAVIRGVAFSSDGKSPSVMEPREPGQLLAMRRAYSATGVDPAAIQFLEAHATATPVGDGVEVRSASKVFRGHEDKVALGSIKAVFGHTGWAAGAVSSIKMIQGFAAGLLPSQTGFDQPNPRLELDSSHFEILKIPKPWPKREGEPRRAAVNGFGFGGSNAHLVLESYEPAYHDQLPHPRKAPASASRVAIVACAPVLPADGPVFRAGEVALPESVIILPDVLDHMDSTQVLGIVAASRALASLPGWQALAEDTGVALGIEGRTGRGVQATARVFRDHVMRRIGEVKDMTENETQTLSRVIGDGLDRILPSGPYTLPGLMPNVAAGRLASVFNFKGPNLVLDSGRASLRSTLALAADWIESGECELALAGGLHGTADPAIEALVHASVAEPESRMIGEGGLLLAVTSEATARAHGWTILALMEAGDIVDGSSAEPVGRHDRCLMGAEGAHEVLQALAKVEAGTPSAGVAWRDGAALNFSPPMQESAQTAAEALLAYSVDMVELPDATGNPNWLAGKRVLVLCSTQPNPACLAFLDGLDYRLVVPAGVDAAEAILVDLSDDATLARSVAAIDAWPCDVVLALRDLEGLAPESVTEGDDTLVELSFAACRHLYARLADHTVAFAGVSLNAWFALGPSLHPATGVLGGFARSIASELPGSLVKVLHADGADPTELRGLLAQELSAGSSSAPAEIACRTGRRFAMKPMPLAPCVGGASLIDADAVVLAVGGARGVTAVLAEALLERFGCTVVILGRSRPESIPAAYLAMDDVEFAACETVFYDDYLNRRPGTRPAEMKRAWKSLAAAREAGRSLAHLKALRGHVSFIEADVTDATAVDAAVEQTLRAHGRIDLVLYGAGTQTSRLLSRRTLAELRDVLRTKLTGIGNIERACARHVRGDPPHFHVLGSAAGVLGNPGQADYAAANEGLSRLSACRSLDASNGTWTTVAWLGWREVGMGADYAGLAEIDGSAWLTRDEGKAFFLRLMAGHPVAPQVGMLHPGTQFPGLNLSSEKPATRVFERNWIVSLEAQPFLAYHKVDGVPTVPAAYSMDIAMRVAAEMCPGLHVTRMESVQLNRFVKIFAPRETVLKAMARVVFEDQCETFVHIRFTTDVVHASGHVLRKNVRVMSGLVVLAKEVSGPTPRVFTESTSQREPRPQPYRSPLSRVKVDGPFDGVDRILVGEDLITASFHVARPDPAHAFVGSIVPVVALDGLFRISGYDASTRDTMPVFAPTHFASIELPPAPIGRGDKLSLRAGRRHFKADSVTIDWAEILDASGETMLRVSGMKGQKMGEVPLLEEATSEVKVEAMESEQ